ncbi:MAG: cytochrome c [Bryobacterales bacterium]|nr:cytochrome c [Bryobacterales bacterium]
MRSALVLCLTAAALTAQSKYGVGRPATETDIKALDIAIAPDGKGLPPGSGTAVQGAAIYERRCQRCHGAKGAGGDESPLVGGQGTLNTPKPLKTVGSYWPHATTLWDYINRAMPFKEPGLLNPDQVYAVSAYILHLNGIVGENDAMDASTLPKVKMPNREGFVADPRPDVKRAR